MINTDFKQGMFKKYDELIIIDPCNTDNWKIVFICENYGITRDVKVISFRCGIGRDVEVTTMDTQFIDTFFKVYKIIKEYRND